MIEVYHATNPIFTKLNDKYLYPDGYKLVAKIDTDDLEMAFALTNHIDKDWADNKNVEVVLASRSTSVGDVAVHNGTAYFCTGVDWEEIQ